MRVLFVIPHPREGASGRHRVFQYLPWLSQQGVACTVRPFMSPALYHILYQPGHLPHKLALATGSLVRRLADVIRAAAADVVVIHREALPLGTAILESLMARLCPAVVFDFDDAIYLNHTGEANAWTRIFRSRAKTARVIALSRHVIAGNPMLGAYASRYNPNVTVIPTPVDTKWFSPPPSRPRTGRLVIGWIGSPTTAGYLRELDGVFEVLARRYPHVEIRVIGAGRLTMRSPNVQAVPWQLERERDELHRFEIGLMPMPDTEWTRGKCAFKALLYMSVGIPVVASPVGVSREIIRDNLSGFLADTSEVWVDRLSRLIEDHPLRERMGQAGRELVEQAYSVRAQAPRLLDVLRRAQARRNGSRDP